MQFKKTLVRLSIFLLPFQLSAQSTNLPQGSKHLHFLDRLEMMMRDNPDLNFSGIKPFSRKTAVKVAELADSLERQFPYDYYFHLTKVDKYNFQSLLMNNQEWAKPDSIGFRSKKPLLGIFYKTKANMLSVQEKDFFVAINPVIQQQQTLEFGNNQRVFLNSKGITGRGLIARKVGFDFYITDNQERPPLYAQNYFNKNRAVPGAGFYKPFKTTAYDYFDGRGSVYFNVAKYFNIQFGYDRNFIGNGYRSLLMSDFATNYLYLKIDTRIWKLNYTNLFMELFPQHETNPGNILLPKKYAATHRLSLNVTPWLNIGLFESVIFGRANRFEFSYLNPVIFLRSIEQQNGSPDNAFVGFDFKANVAHRGQFYGQIMLDEFVLKEARSGNGWWGNKFGVQLGGKTIDVFDVKNLDLQGELNVVRPFTYSHFNTIANYTHYNQPLAHPLGADFTEFIGIVRYQPTPKWTAQLKLIYFVQGLDTAGQNLGNNIFLISGTRPFDYGYKIPTGLKSKGLNSSLLVSYEWKENLFLDGSFLYRNIKATGRTDLSSHTSLLTIGIRVNMFRREYDY
ncbi:MAG: capsule assembly Wzi family protein [Chitinophagaceae bacterium]